MPQYSCEEIKLFPIHIPTEDDFLQTILDVCELTMSRLPPYGSPYGNGFNSLVECIRFHKSFQLKSLASTAYGDKNTVLNDLFHPMVTLTPTPPCDVNRKWF